MSGENYVHNEHDIKQYNSISVINLEQSDDETDYEDDPIYDTYCLRQPGEENNLTGNVNILNYNQDDVGPTDNKFGLSSQQDVQSCNVIDEEQIYDVIRGQHTEENNSPLALASALDQRYSPLSRLDCNYDYQEYYLTREQYNEEVHPAGEVRERVTILEKSQYSALNSNDNKQASKSFTGVIRKKLKNLFSRRRIEKSLPEVFSRKNIKESLSEFVRVAGSNGNIYYEYVGDKTREEDTSESLYELLPIPRSTDSEVIYYREHVEPPKLPPRIVPSEPSTSKLEIELKQELRYQNIIEHNITIGYDNLFPPKLPPRSPLSIPYPPEFETTLDGHLSRNLLYKILLPTISSTNTSTNVSNIIFQYEILLSLKPTTTFIYQNILDDFNYFYYNIAISFKLPKKMRVYKPTISKLIHIAETNMNYKILLFLEQLPDSNLYSNLSKRPLPATPNSTTSNTEAEIDYSNYSSNQKPLRINLSYNKETEIKTYLHKQLPSRDLEKEEFDVIILSFKLPPNTSLCNDLKTNSPDYYKLPLNNYSYNDKDLERKSSECDALPKDYSLHKDLETNKSSENYETRKQISSEHDNFEITNKLSLNYEITLPPHIFAPHSKFVNRELPPTPPLSPDYAAPESFLSKSLRALNRLSFFIPQYEPIYEDISHFYHEIRYRNSLFVPDNDYLYGIPGEAFYDQILDGNESEISDITYDPVRWSMARIDKKGKPLKQIFELLWTLICTGMYIVDVGSDMSLAFRYWSQGKGLYCGLTLSLVYLASTVDVLYCIYRKELSKKDTIFWFRFIIMFLINLRGVSEYVYLMKLEYRIITISFENKEIQRNLQLQRARVAALNSYEGIFEACPQLVLQLYLILTFDKDFDVTFFMQVVTVISSLCACGAAFVNMEKGLRLEDYGVNDLSILGIIVQYLWLSPLTASRLLSVSLLLSVAPLWLWLGAALHLLLGATLYWRRNEAQASTRKLVNACVYGARILISPYEPAYVRYVVPMLNIVHVLQNVVATAAWAAVTAPRTPAAVVVAVCAVNLIAHTLGLFFAVLFHKCKRRFCTFHKVSIVDYGYAVVQIV